MAFVTANDKELEIYTDPQTAHVKVKFKEGGQLPEELSGLFTSKAVAEVAVTSYLLRTHEEKAKKKENKEFVKKLKEESKED